MKKILGLILAVGLMLGALPARAEYPDKAITCIVPFAPGGAADITVRMVADYLSKEIGQPLVIVNKGGGSGIPGLNFGLKARPDGYTVLGGSIGNAFVATYFLGAPAYDMDKIAFVGEDEIATTTLFKILMEELEPDAGTFKWGTTITTSYFPLDNSAFFNDCDLNLVDWLAQFTPKIPEANTESFKRAFLGRMLFSGDDVFKPVKVLSGGEKVRCMLSRMMLYGSNVLVLDQPTNHLDLESITAVNNGLMDFKGVVLFSSHDHEFVQTIANRIMVLEDGKLTDRLGTYEDYIASMANTAE